MNIQDLKSNTTWQEASNTINNNNNKISLAIATLENAKLKNKGYFITVEKLNEAIPNPTIGSKAYVGTSEPYAIYIVENGAWVDSGYTGGNETVAKITTDRIENGAVTTEKIAISAFDNTLSVSGKIAPADVVGGKLIELEEKLFGNGWKEIDLTNDFVVGAIINGSLDAGKTAWRTLIYTKTNDDKSFIVKLKGLSGGAGTPQIGYYDQSNVFHLVKDVATDYDDTYTPPADAIKITFTTVFNNASIVYSVKVLRKTTDCGVIGTIDNEIDTLKSKSDNIVVDVNKLKKEIEGETIIVDVPFVEINQKIINADGTISGASSAWSIATIDIKANEKYYYKATSLAPSPLVSVQLKDDTDSVLKNYVLGADIQADEEKEIIISHNGTMTFSWRTGDGYNVSLKKEDKKKQNAYTKSINKNVNFVGMSIWWYDSHQLANGHMGGEIARGYQTLLKEQFDFLSDTGTNYCYSGNSLGATSEGDTYCIMNHSSNWLASSNAIWTLDSITNDFKRNIPIGSYADYANKTGLLTYYGALREFADKVASLSGDGAIVVCSNALRRNNGGYTSTSNNTQNHSLIDYEHALMDIASRNHWYFVDQFRLCGVADDSIDLTTIDGLHLNNFGYTLAVKPWIEMFGIIKNIIL